MFHCAVAQAVCHVLANVSAFWLLGGPTATLDLPLEAPTYVEFFRELLACFVVGDFFIYWEHYYMHKFAFLRKYVHNFHHEYKSPLFSWCAGWVHPAEIAVALLCELAYPVWFAVHPLTIWVFISLWVFLLVEEHSGHNVFWSPHNILPFEVGGGSKSHDLHHKPFYTKNYSFIFSAWDHLFGTYEPPTNRNIALHRQVLH